MTRPIIFITLYFCITGNAAAQSQASVQQVATVINEVYQIPFASEGNQIELAVSNVGVEVMEQVEVVATVVPEWLNLHAGSITLGGIEASGEGYALFDFSVDREALVGESSRLAFEIRTGVEVIGQKEFVLAVAAPDKVQLDQNYPNPFATQTMIGFDVVQEGPVYIVVYDMLGREVEQVMNEPLEPGHHVVEWDGSSLASGIYFYVLKAHSTDGNVELRRNKMMLVK